jgi:proline racemase
MTMATCASATSPSSPTARSIARPRGSGTASRVALLAVTGALAGDRQLIHESIV